MGLNEVHKRLELTEEHLKKKLAQKEREKEIEFNRHIIPIEIEIESIKEKLERMQFRRSCR